MAESEATIPENSENSETPEPQEALSEPAPSNPAPAGPPATEPKRGRGRPAGSKDKAPRVKVREEPIPQPEPKPAPVQSAPAPVQAVDLPDKSPPVVERPPSPEPPSPRTLFRQTSAHLVNLREVMNSQKRASTAEKYTSRLHAWPVV